MTRFVTERQAEALTVMALSAYLVAPEVLRVNGWYTSDDYSIVADDDPRLISPQPVCDTETSE